MASCRNEMQQGTDTRRFQRTDDEEGCNLWEDDDASDLYDADPFSGDHPKLKPKFSRECYEAHAESVAMQLSEIPWTPRFWRSTYPEEEELSELELLKWRVEITRLYRPTGTGGPCPADDYFSNSLRYATEELAFFHCLMEVTSRKPGAFIGANLGSEVARLSEEAARKQRRPGVFNRLIKACKLPRAQRAS